MKNASIVHSRLHMKDDEDYMLKRKTKDSAEYLRRYSIS